MKIRKKDRNEKLPFHLRIKKYKILLSYYFKNFKGRFFNLAYLLFIVNIILFLMVLVPNLAHRAPMPIGSWPIVLELHGKVLKAEGINGNLSPAVAIEVRIGGYSTVTDSNGEFYLTFTSKTYTDIPIVFCWSNASVIKWICFQQGQFEKEEIFILE